MTELNQRGVTNILLIPFILTVVFFVAAASFGIWAYLGRADYKNNSDQKSAVAVDAALKQEDIKKDAEFAEKEKFPLKNYTSPANVGSVSINYPKTWSAYVSETATGTILVSGFFHPDYVPASGVGYALRLSIVNSAYSKELASFDAAVKKGTIKASPYRAPKVNTVLGSRLDGEVVKDRQGSMIILPVRDKTVEIWTESTQFTKDLENEVLANLTFSP